MRILVTGATGYVGSRLVAELLAAGHQVVAAARKPARLRRFGWCDDVTGVARDAGADGAARAALAAAGRIDVVYYLLHGAAAEPAVPAGSYDICGPETTSCRGLLETYARVSGRRRGGVAVRGVHTAVASRVSAAALPVPGGLVGDLVAPLDFPMRASDARLGDLMADPPGGLTPIQSAVTCALASYAPRPVSALADPHHLADTDPVWAGFDALRIRRNVQAVTPPIAHRALGLVDIVPGPVAGAIRTGLDALINLAPIKLAPTNPIPTNPIPTNPIPRRRPA